MKTNVQALKDLYVALGGEAADVADMSTSVEVLNAISAKYSGADDAVLNPDAIDNIAAVAGDIGGGGSQTMYHVVVNSVPITDQYINAQPAYNDGAYTALPIDDSGLPSEYVEKKLDNGLNDAHFDFLVYADDAEPIIYTTEMDNITPTVTGNIELVSDEGWHFHVTGDGTITFTAQ